MSALNPIVIDTSDPPRQEEHEVDDDEEVYEEAMTGLSPSWELPAISSGSEFIPSQSVPSNRSEESYGSDSTPVRARGRASRPDPAPQTEWSSEVAVRSSSPLGRRTPEDEVMTDLPSDPLALRAQEDELMTDLPSRPSSRNTLLVPPQAPAYHPRSSPPLGPRGPEDDVMTDPPPRPSSTASLVLPQGPVKIPGVWATFWFHQFNNRLQELLESEHDRPLVLEAYQVVASAFAEYDRLCQKRAGAYRSLDQPKIWNWYEDPMRHGRVMTSFDETTRQMTMAQARRTVLDTMDVWIAKLEGPRPNEVPTNPKEKVVRDMWMPLAAALRKGMDILRRNLRQAVAFMGDTRAATARQERAAPTADRGGAQRRSLLERIEANVDEEAGEDLYGVGDEDDDDY